MTEELVDIADLDCIFLTYDEPKKEEFWIKLQNMVPWAKRVDGVKGSDAAHKAAAAASDTASCATHPKARGASPSRDRRGPA